MAEVAGRTRKALNYYYTTKVFAYLDRYKKEKRIAHGAFGVVYKYALKDEEPRNGQAGMLSPAIAVKVLNEFTGDDLSKANRVLLHREVNVTGTCDHPNIIRCFGVCEVDGATALALELCKCDLGTFLSEAPGRKLTYDQTRRVLWQASSALRYMQSVACIPIIHRDLKPQNILVRDENLENICISDFGLAKFVRASCDPRLTRSGTPSYSAPEMQLIDGETHISAPHDKGHPADVYSLGVIGFELVTGQRPPQATDEAKVSRWVEERARDIQDWRLRHFLLSCVKWRPEDRIKKEALLLHEYLLLYNVPRGNLLKESIMMPGGFKTIKYRDHALTEHEHIAIETLVQSKDIPKDEPVFNTCIHHDALVPVLGTVSNNGHLVIIAKKPLYQKALVEVLESDEDFPVMLTVLMAVAQLLQIGSYLEELPGVTYVHNYQMHRLVFSDPDSFKIQVLLPRTFRLDLQKLALPCKPEDPNDFCNTLSGFIGQLLRRYQHHLESTVIDGINKSLKLGRCPAGSGKAEETTKQQNQKEILIHAHQTASQGLDTKARREIFTSHLMGKRFLVCGHRDGSISLSNLDTMKVLALEQEQFDWITCIASNARFFICGSWDGTAMIWERPTKECPKLKPLKNGDETDVLPPGDPIWTCATNDDFIGLGRYSIEERTGFIQVFTASQNAQLVNTIRTSRPCLPKGLQLLVPSGNKFWAADDEDVVLYEDGREKKRLSVGERVYCISVSRAAAGTIWVGTDNGHLFRCDTATGEVTKLSVELDGGEVWQIEEVQGGERLVVNHCASPSDSITLISTDDWTKKTVFRDNSLSCFCIIKDLVIFGNDRKIKFVLI